MSKESSEALFKLIKSLKRTEKRYFRVQNALESQHNKYFRLFELLDQSQRYDEDFILTNAPEIKKQQLSNLKAHLYKRLLQSIRQYNLSTVMDIQIREMIDHAQLLFNRGLYDQCLDIIKKAKKKTKKIDNLELQLEILKWEKSILSQTIGVDNELRVNRIINEVEEANNRINNINQFTNLAAKLNAIYTKVGFIRSQSDYDAITSLFDTEMPDYQEESLSLKEKIHLYSLYTSYFHFLQDFEQGYIYAKKWLDLYKGNKELKQGRVESYLNAINTLMIGQYKMSKYQEFVLTFRRLREIRHYPKNLMNENIRLKLLKYTYVHEFNRIFMLGDFKAGVSLLSKIKPQLSRFIVLLDNHSKIILYYKIACLYFGNGNYRECIQWLNRIFNSEHTDLREDIHSFARILNLISHYELGHMDVIDYYIRSTYRFMLKKDDLHRFQKAILSFLRKLAEEFKEEDLIPEFKKLLNKLTPLQESAFEKRAFIYFDIISWLESKIDGKRVGEVIASKAPL